MPDVKPRVKPLAAHPCKLSEFHFLGGALSVGWAQLSYILALLAFFTLDIANDAPVMLSVLAGCVVAQVFSSFQLAVAEREFGRPVHHKFCHRIQAVYVCMAWFFVRGAFAAIWASIFTYLLCPKIFLWLPLKRPAATPQHPVTQSGASAANKRRCSSQNTNPVSQAPSLGAPASAHSRRYEPSVWGLAWAAQSSGRKRRAATPPEVAAGQQPELCVVDHIACRRLSVQLEQPDLQQRLVRSPYHQRQIPAAESWLREAAEAFGVPLRLRRQAVDGRWAWSDKSKGCAR